ncbi:MAG TPA: hypothetical protein VFD53_09785 [Ilumatobacter sp.]|nr:hypothetical protein [Ilumatobacter sp.]
MIGVPLQGPPPRIRTSTSATAPEMRWGVGADDVAAVIEVVAAGARAAAAGAAASWLTNPNVNVPVSSAKEVIESGLRSVVACMRATLSAASKAARKARQSDAGQSLKKH